MAKLNINGKTRNLAVEPDTPLLWAIREQARPHRHQVRLRRRAMRRLLGAHQRRGAPLLLDSRSAASSRPIAS